ncbi:adenylate/guanylate cyclase domain-containing protein [Shimia sp. CNT1-13L.2]|uniref:adenylate/guanylate cyclase domain-containing protein n=1 Tax=Shimia sp. CNT1-13L.2 TaxID=2959663 RepID=UPI0020CDFF52|nr:adenylate/guanylate cyclase domain-containing protein [Shimia sp. CNT1-13L.2]MCP9482924.1 adenylate/guanylate cyclase domain-containing protein [Shimia sp. CNT1-13L.2]
MAKRRSIEARELARWLVQMGLEGAGQAELLEGYCAKVVALGVPIMRVQVAHRSFHPKFGGIGFTWRPEGGVTDEQYPYMETPPPEWHESPFYEVLTSGAGELRERLTEPGCVSRFPVVRGLQQEGATDYLTMAISFGREEMPEQLTPNNMPEGVMISWTSDGPEGFSESDLDVLRNTVQELGLALKSAANRQTAKTLLQVYLGRDAGRRVLSGEIRRGSVEAVNAVILFFDLAAFTALTERSTGRQTVAMLNDYFGLAVDAVRSEGGNVLKFMGDGMLAMFGQDDIGEAARAALRTADRLRREMSEANERRMAAGEPATGYTMALHAGEILYGNIGADTRLDFTVIGSTVNTAARMGTLNAALGHPIVISAEVRAAAGDVDHEFIPLGEHWLRGVSEPKVLFSIEEKLD